MKRIFSAKRAVRVALLPESGVKSAVSGLVSLPPLAPFFRAKWRSFQPKAAALFGLPPVPTVKRRTGSSLRRRVFFSPLGSAVPTIKLSGEPAYHGPWPRQQRRGKWVSASPTKSVVANAPPGARGRQT